MGVSKLVDLVQDEREVIRNDVSRPNEKNLDELRPMLGSAALANLDTIECEYSEDSRVRKWIRTAVRDLEQRRRKRRRYVGRRLVNACGERVNDFEV